MKKRRNSKGKIPYELLGGVAVGAAASAVVTKVTDKISIFSANPGYVSYAKIGAGVAVMLYGGKSQIVQGLGLGMVAKGGQEVITQTGVLDSLLGPAVAGMPPLNTYQNRRHVVMPNPSSSKSFA